MVWGCSDMISTITAKKVKIIYSTKVSSVNADKAFEKSKHTNKFRRPVIVASELALGASITYN